MGMSEWQRVALGDITERVRAKGPSPEVKVYTVSAVHGLIDQESYFTRSVASKDRSSYYVVEAGDFVYNKSTSKDAPYGVVAQNLSGGQVAVTPLYIAFRSSRNDVDPRFLLLACNSADFFNSLAGTLREGARAHGLLNVRLPEFFGARVALPPLAEQRRIVHLMASIDAHIEALEEERLALESCLGALAASLWDSTETRTVGDLGSVITGNTPSTKRSEYWTDGDVPFLTPGDLGALTRVAETMRHVTHAGAQAGRVLPANSVCVVCIGASIGKVGVTAVDGCISNQQINSISGLNDRDALYTALVLSSRQAQRLIETQAGTTTMPLLNKSAFSALVVPWPAQSERAVAATVGEAMMLEIEALEQERATAIAARRALLSHLLDRRLALPETYDVVIAQKEAAT